MVKKIIIIGGGVYGLAAGTYLAMNGFDTEIYEMHNLPGGVCTAWKRKDFTFDFCIHWLMGSSPGKSMHMLWQELGVIQSQKIIEYDIYVQWQNKAGETFSLFTDPERLRTEMYRVGPEDKHLIDQLINTIIKFSKLDLPLRKEDETIGVLFKMLTLLPYFIKWGKLTVTELANRFKSPVLRQFFFEKYSASCMGDFPVTGVLMMLAYMAAKSNGYPAGGSLNFSRAMEKAFKKHGGKIFYRHKVEKILVEDGKALGIITNGKEIFGDYIISAADGHATFGEMLGGRFHSHPYENAYRTWKSFPSLIFIAFGLARKFDNMPSIFFFETKTSLAIEDDKQTLKHLSIRLFNHDDTMAPAGNTSVISMISTYNYNYWTSLKKENPKKYEEEKKRIADWVIDEAESFFHDFKNKIEVIDVATPDTIIRYTGNWHGSYEGWLPDCKNMMTVLPANIPDLKKFYMVGQWVSAGGGLPPAAMGGRRLAQQICKQEKKKFRVKQIHEN